MESPANNRDRPSTWSFIQLVSVGLKNLLFSKTQGFGLFLFNAFFKNSSLISLGVFMGDPATRLSQLFTVRVMVKSGPSRGWGRG